MTAICNTCNHIVIYKGGLSHQKCSCGSKDLSTVSAQLNEHNNTWEYKDRKGEVRKVVPRGAFHEDIKMHK